MMKKYFIVTVMLLVPAFSVSFAQSLGDGKPCDLAATITDVDGNVYHTVSIGKQCWLKENMRATKFAEGGEIKKDGELSASEAIYYIPEGDVEQVGYLYNWAAVNHKAASHAGIQGPCPNGWHVPTDAEWSKLETYTAGIGRYVCGEGESNISKALAASSGWFSNQRECAVGTAKESNDATGFSAIPAGVFNGSFSGKGTTANFWTATSASGTYSYSRSLDYAESTVFRSNDNKKYGLSVRCVMD